MVAPSEEFPSLATRSRIKVEKVADVHPLAVDPKAEVALYPGPAAGSALDIHEVERLFYLDVQSGLKTEGAEKAIFLAVEGGMRADEALSLAVRTGLKAEEEVHALLLQQLLASFDSRRKDPELFEWEHPPYSIIEKKKPDPKCPFFLFKMKASAKNAQVSWRQKRCARFHPERAGYTAALRVARLVAGPYGRFHLEQAGEGGQPGTLSFHSDNKYMGRRRLKEDVFQPEGSSVPPLREVAVIKRLPGGDGISIMSYVRGLGVKLHDILFVLPCSSNTVAVTFTERWFYVSSKFTEEPLYASAGLDFIDITVPVENLIKKLYHMYEQEEQQKKIMRGEQQGRQDTEALVEQQQKELILQREEQERKKLEDLQRRRADSRKQKCLRKELKDAAHRMNEGARTEVEQGHVEEYDDACFCTPIFPTLEAFD